MSFGSELLHELVNKILSIKPKTIHPSPMKLRRLMLPAALLLALPVFATELRICDGFGDEGVLASAKIKEYYLRVENGGITIKIFAHDDGGKGKKVTLNPKTWKNINKITVVSASDNYAFIRFSKEQTAEAFAFYQVLRTGGLGVVRLSGENRTYAYHKEGEDGLEIEVHWGDPKDSIRIW